MQEVLTELRMCAAALAIFPEATAEYTIEFKRGRMLIAKLQQLVERMPAGNSVNSPDGEGVAAMALPTHAPKCKIGPDVDYFPTALHFSDEVECIAAQQHDHKDEHPSCKQWIELYKNEHQAIPSYEQLQHFVARVGGGAAVRYKDYRSWYEHTCAQ